MCSPLCGCRLSLSGHDRTLLGELCREAAGAAWTRQIPDERAVATT
jgi:hypothetical protein